MDRYNSLYNSAFCSYHNWKHFYYLLVSGGSRISRWVGADLRRRHFLVKTYVKTKELDPVEGARTGGAPLDPPM